MRHTPALWTVLPLVLTSAWLTACGDDDGGPRDAGAEQDAAPAGKGGSEAGRSGGGAGGRRASGDVCESDTRPWSEYCGRSGILSACDETFSELQTKLCGRVNGNGQIKAGPNSCGGTSITDNTTPTSYRYHFDATGMLIGAEIISDICSPPRGERYGMICNQKEKNPLDCPDAGFDAGSDAGKDSGTDAAANSGDDAGADAG